MNAGRRADLKGWTRRDDGTRLAHQVVGPYGAPALLLLQGQANDHHWWDRLRGDFTDRFLTITFDYRGTGRTELSGTHDDDAWSTRAFADDAAAVLEALGRERACVYGTSMGGRVAQHLAARRPDLVERLVLAGTSPGGAQAVERDQSVRRALADPDPRARLRATVDLFYTPAWVARWGGVERVPRDLLGDPTMTADAGRRHLRVSASHDAGDVLAQIAAPTLVLHGTDDLMVPAVNARTLAAAIPDATLRLVEGGRHGFFDEFRDEVVPAVRGFLSGSALSSPVSLRASRGEDGDMTFYFDAPTDGEALLALPDPPKDDENFSSALSPGSDDFAALAALVVGGADDDPEVYVTLDADGKAQTLGRIGDVLRDTTADLDETALQGLAGPWVDGGALADGETDPVEFLTAFQHLCRNAVAEGNHVYAVDDA